MTKRQKAELKEKVITLVTVAEEIADDCGLLDYVPMDERIQGIIWSYEYFMNKDEDYIMQICEQLNQAAEETEDETNIKQARWFKEDCTEFLKG